MIEASQYLAFAQKTAHGEVGVHSTGNHFDCDSASILVIGANGQVDRAHAATADFPNQFIGADSVAGSGLGTELRYQEGRVVDRWTFDKRPRFMVGGNEGFDFRTQGGIIFAGFGKEGVSVIWFPR
jgi:hypothetical protein